MLERFTAFLAAPAFEDEAKTRTAALLNIILLLSLVSVVLYSIGVLLLIPQQIDRLLLVSAFYPIAIVLLWLLRRGHVRLTGMLAAAGLWTILTLSALTAGGVHALAFSAYALVILIAGLVLGRRITYSFALLSSLTGLALLQVDDHAPSILSALFVSPTPFTVWIAQSLFFLTTAAVVVQSRRSSDRALRHAQREIAERKQAESAVQEQRDFALQVMNALGQGLALTDTAWRFESVNPAYARMAGRSAEELIGKTPQDITHPDDCAKLDEEQHARKQGLSTTYTTRLLRPDGDIVHALISSVPRRQSDRIAGNIVVATDLTELKQVEKTQAQLLAMLEATPDFVGTLDAREQLTYVNRAGRQMIGLRDDEDAPHIHLRDYHPGWAYAIIAREGIPTATRAGAWSGESALLSRAGRETPVMQTILAHKNAQGDVDYLSIVARDISEQKRASERFRRIVESMPNAIVVTGADNAIVLVNSHAEKLFGYQRQQLVGQSVELLVPERFRRQHAQYRKAFAVSPQTRAMGAGRDLYALRKDGSEILVEIGLTPIHTHEGLLILSTITDITQRKQAQIQIEHQAHLLANVHDAILATDERMILTAWNHAAEELYGWSANEVLGKSLEEIIRSESDATQKQEALQVLQKIGHHRSVMLQTRRDGQPLYIEGSTIALRDKHGVIIGYASVNRDITQRKYTETALKESEARLRAVIDNLPFDFWACDSQGYYIMQNPRSRATWGDLIGKRPEDAMIDEEITGEWRSTRQRAFRGEIVHTEDESIVNGQKRYTYKTVAPIRDTDQIHGLIGVTIDLTAQRLMEQAYRTLVEQSLQGILVLQNNRIVFANPSIAEILGLTVDELLNLSSRAITTLAHADDRALILARIQELSSASAVPQRGEFRVIRKDGEIRWIEISAARIDYQGQLAIQATVIDITDRKKAAQELLRRNEELALLNRAAQAFNASLNRDQILALILSQVREQLHVTACSAWLIDPPSGELVCLQASGAQREVLHGWRLKRGQGLAGWVVVHGESLLVSDAQNDARHFRGVDQRTGLALRSILSVPLRVSQTIIGVLQVADESSGRFDASDQMLVESLLATASIALENAQLYAEVQHHAAALEQHVTERTIELTETNVRLQQEIAERARAEAAEREQRTFAEALRDVLAALNSTLDFEEVLDTIIASVELVVPHDAVNLMLVDESGATRIMRHRGRGEQQLKEILTQANFGEAQIVQLRGMAEMGQTIIVEDTHTLPNRVSLPELEWIRSHVTAPIRLNGKFIGYLGLYSETPGYFIQLHADRLRVFADQAAIAIRNAQLFQQSQELAVLEERQRLARDLHDAVSQALFSASVMSETLPRLWERNPQQVRTSLDELHRLTRGALAEMRTLLLELRPAALAGTPLNDLLLQLGEAVHARSRVKVKVVGVGECLLSLDAKTALYRITQEALNNIVKHAHAHEVDMQLDCQSNEIRLRICDDGRGFDPARAGQDRLGLSIMRERAESIGARFELNSTLGHGTEIIVTCPNKLPLAEKD